MKQKKYIKLIFAIIVVILIFLFGCKNNKNSNIKKSPYNEFNDTLTYSNGNILKDSLNSNLDEYDASGSNLDSIIIIETPIAENIEKNTVITRKDTIKINDKNKNKKLTLPDIYLSQVGVRELTGKNDGVEVEMYLKSVGLGKGYAWCSAFVHWALDSAGYKNTINAWSPTAHNSNNIVYFNKNLKKDLIPGDVFTLYYPSLKRIGHAGFYHSTINSSIFETVEGNTNDAGSREGDGVYRKRRSFNATYSITRWTD